MTNSLLQENGDRILTESGDRLLGKFDLDAYETIIASLLPDIEAYQDTYILSNPRYFQGLETHSVTPKDDTTADRLNVAPQGKTTTWQDTNLISSALPFSVKINEYRTHDGQLGYTVIFIANDGTDLWYRAVGYGPLSVSKTYTWRKQVPE